MKDTIPPLRDYTPPSLRRTYPPSLTRSDWMRVADCEHEFIATPHEIKHNCGWVLLRSERFDDDMSAVRAAARHLKDSHPEGRV